MAAQSPPSGPRPSHLVVVQYAGDPREAYHRLAAGGPEYYHAQRYSVESISALRARRPARAVTVVVLVGGDAYDELLPDGVRVVSLGWRAGQPDHAALLARLDALAPDELVLRVPNRRVIAWALRRRIPVLALLAESLSRAGWRARLHAWRTARLLARPGVQLVAAYGRASAQDYARRGIDPRKIVAWDFLLEDTPVAPPRSLAAPDADGYRIFFGGVLVPDKGVDELLQAHARLLADGLPVRLRIAGDGQRDAFEARAASLGTAASVAFIGRIPTPQIEAEMARSHAVVVPSRHAFPEGFPLVIHHALRTSTPLVVSDHPMLAQVLRHDVNALVFPAGDAHGLAAQLRRLLGDATLYRRLSAASDATWQALRLPVKWADVLDAWADRHDDGGRALAALQRA